MYSIKDFKPRVKFINEIAEEELKKINNFFKRKNFSPFSFADKNRKACGILINGYTIDSLEIPEAKTHTSLIACYTDEYTRNKLRLNRTHKDNWDKATDFLIDSEREYENSDYTSNSSYTYNSSYTLNLFKRFSHNTVSKITNGTYTEDDDFAFYNILWNKIGKDCYINLSYEEAQYDQSIIDIDCKNIIDNIRKNPKYNFKNYYIFICNCHYGFSIYKNEDMLISYDDYLISWEEIMRLIKYSKENEMKFVKYEIINQVYAHINTHKNKIKDYMYVIQDFLTDDKEILNFIARSKKIDENCIKEITRLLIHNRMNYILKEHYTIIDNIEKYKPIKKIANRMIKDIISDKAYFNQVNVKVSKIIKDYNKRIQNKKSDEIITEWAFNKIRASQKQNID